MNDTKYTVWVGGGEVTDFGVSYEKALDIYQQYISDGYDDVVIEKVEKWKNQYIKIICTCLKQELSYRLTHNPEDATYPAIYREFHKGILFTIGIQLNKSLNEMMEVLKWVKIMK